MLLKEWNELPESMKTREVKVYYDILQKRKGSLVLKRLFDIVMSSVLIVFASPVLLFVAAWIKLDSEGPVFYRQERVTQYGRKFRIFKFRTMVTNADKIGTLVTTNNDSRITRVGEKIRKCRLDELPQLFNILKGDISLVGPRPVTQRELEDNYTIPQRKALLSIRPGLTGYWQVVARSDSSYENGDRQKLELEYLTIRGFWYDIGLLFRTIPVVLKRKGAK